MNLASVLDEDNILILNFEKFKVSSFKSYNAFYPPVPFVFDDLKLVSNL